jgi:hypothetical protein
VYAGRTHSRAQAQDGVADAAIDAIAELDHERGVAGK